MKQYASLFRNRNFLLHWMAGATSYIGDFFNSLALLKVLSEDPDHLGLYMAMIMIAKVLPGVLLGPIAGVMADRLPRRTIMITADLLRAVLIVGLVFVEQPAHILTLVFLAAIVAVFYHPASSALMPNLVKKEELVTAGSLSVMTQRMAMVLGNGIGAVVLMMVGAHNVFYIDAASFVISAIFISFMVLPVEKAAPQEEPAEKPSVWQKFRGDLKETLDYIKGEPVIRNLMAVLALAGINDSALSVLLVTFFTITLGLTAETMGLSWAIFGGASVVGAMVLGAMGNKIHWRHLITFGGAYVWVCMVGAILISKPVPSIAFMGMLGLGSGAANVGIQTAVGALVPDRVRGRVFATWGMVQNLIFVIGTVSAGFLSDRFGPAPVLLGFSVFLLAAAVYAFLTLKPAAVTTQGVPAPAAAK